MAVFRGPDPAAGGFSGGHPAGLQKRHDEGSVLTLGGTSKQSEPRSECGEKLFAGTCVGVGLCWC